MQLHHFATLLGVSWLGAALSISLDKKATSVKDNADQNAEQEPLDDMAEAAAAPLTPCSCDCCQVDKFLPQSARPFPGGDVFCNKPFQVPGEENPSCPGQCTPGEGTVLHSNRGGELDYSRFCLYSCRPVSETAGDQCVQHEAKHIDAANAPDGNGAEVMVPPVHVDRGPGKLAEGDDDSGNVVDGTGKDGAVSDDEESDSQAASAKAAASSTKETAEAKAQIIYDMRKLVAERLRSEAGAMVSSGASSAEATRLNLWNAEQSATQSKKISVTALKVAGKLEGDVTGVAAAKQTAEESERKTRSVLAKSYNFVAGVMKKVKELTDAAVKEAIAPCILKAAEYRAHGRHLDKPEDWDKVVGARAANPYQAAVTAAVQRTAEYKRLADGLQANAAAEQQQANFLMPHVTLMEAQGDVLGAAIERKRAHDLLKSAENLQTQAQGYWNTANQAQSTVNKWQDAAAQATAYASWEYKASEQAFKSPR